jgi:hypothetical protein
MIELRKAAMTIKAHFDGKVLVPDEPVNLPEGTPLVLHVESPAQPPQEQKAESRGMTAGELLQSGFVGLWKDREDIGDTLEFARKLRDRAQRRTR